MNCSMMKMGVCQRIIPVTLFMYMESIIWIGWIGFVPRQLKKVKSIETFITEVLSNHCMKERGHLMGCLSIKLDRKEKRDV